MFLQTMKESNKKSSELIEFIIINIEKIVLYRFQFKNLRYSLQFSELRNNQYLFEFDFEKINKRIDNLNGNISLTICNIIEEFLISRPNAKIIFIHESNKSSDISRFRLFNIWFEKYNNDQFKKLNIQSTQNEIFSIIFMKPNKNN
jgi:hypothetical protein